MLDLLARGQADPLAQAAARARERGNREALARIEAARKAVSGADALLVRRGKEVERARAGEEAQGDPRGGRGGERGAPGAPGRAAPAAPRGARGAAGDPAAHGRRGPGAARAQRADAFPTSTRWSPTACSKGGGAFLPAAAPGFAARLLAVSSGQGVVGAAGLALARSRADAGFFHKLWPRPRAASQIRSNAAIGAGHRPTHDFGVRARRMSPWPAARAFSTVLPRPRRPTGDTTPR